MTEITHETSKSASVILSEAALLSEEEWTKRAYFRVGSQENKIILCRCAHGQIQWCGRESGFQQKIKNRLSKVGGVGVEVEVGAGVEVEVGVGIEVGIAVAVGGVYQDKNLEQWLSFFDKKYSLKFNRSLFLAHYYAARAGLTTSFNDNSTTTHGQVVTKLNEAAQLAASEGE